MKAPDTLRVGRKGRGEGSASTRWAGRKRERTKESRHVRDLSALEIVREVVLSILPPLRFSSNGVVPL